MKNMTKPFLKVLFEAIVVGFGMVILGIIILYFSKPDFTTAQKRKTLLAFFLSGIIFHLVLEYTGINAWYSNIYVALEQQRIDKNKGND